MGRLLTHEQVAQYERDGYVYPFRALSDADAKILRHRIEAFEAEQACEEQALVSKAHRSVDPLHSHSRPTGEVQPGPV